MSPLWDWATWGPVLAAHVVGPYIFAAYWWGAMADAVWFYRTPAALLRFPGLPFNAVTALLVAFLTVYCVVAYLKCAWTDPGLVPAEFSFDHVGGELSPNETSPLTNFAQHYVNDSVDRAGSPLDHSPPPKMSIERAARSRTAVCYECRHFKPERTHHCSKCRRCVLMYHHHCFFTARCVGYYNLKYYLQYVVATWLLTSICSLMLLVPAANATIHTLRGDLNHAPGCEHGSVFNYVYHHAYHHHRHHPHEAPPLPMTLMPQPILRTAGICVVWTIPVFALAVLAQTWVGYLMGANLPLAFKNMTRIEAVLWGEDSKSPYDTGNGRWSNLAVICGHRFTWWDLLFPTTPDLSLVDAVVHAKQFDPDHREEEMGLTTVVA